MADITLAIDAGGSQTKVIYALGSDGKKRCLCMSTEVEQIKKQKLEDYLNRQDWVGNPAPIAQAWIEWDKEVVALGRFAQHFDPEDRIKERKYENALYKVLAILGILIDQHQVAIPPRRNLVIDLGILLPWNEYNDRSLFQAQLSKMLAKFKFQKSALKLELGNFLCRPEGGGIAASYARSQGRDWLREKRLAVLMFGHRNTTVLYLEYGELKLGDSPLLGFSLLVDRVVEQIGGLDRDAVMVALAEAMQHPHQEFGGDYGRKVRVTQYPDWAKVEQVQALSSAKSATLRAEEIKRLAQVIPAAIEEYWDKLEHWLKRNLPQNDKLDLVLIGGGAATFLRPKLEKHFNSGEQPDSTAAYRAGRTHASIEMEAASTPIDWCADLQGQVQQLTFPAGQRTDATFTRFVDCFGLFDYLVASARTAKQSQPKNHDDKTS